MADAIIKRLEKLSKIVNSNNQAEVLQQDAISETVDLYLHTVTAEPSITAGASIDDESITVDAITGVTAGDVITIYENNSHYQSLVVSTATNTINLASPLDCAFTTDADVYVGKWNLNLNGSSTAIKAYILAPPSGYFDLQEIRISMLDSSPMDDALFGGITALTNGLLIRRVDGTVKNKALVVNNLGFKEFGFDVSYSDKAPAGKYGLLAKKNYKAVNGVVIRLSGTSGDEMQAWLRDDFTDLDQLSIIISGHVVED